MSTENTHSSEPSNKTKGSQHAARSPIPSPSSPSLQPFVDRTPLKEGMRAAINNAPLGHNETQHFKNLKKSMGPLV